MYLRSLQSRNTAFPRCFSIGVKVSTPTVPVACGNAKLIGTFSQELRAHMHGKSCFNFKTVDDALLKELEQVTAESLRGMQGAGYISDVPAPVSEESKDT
jgi:hypothetical protein